MPVLLRGLSPFSDSGKKGVESDTVKHLYLLTTWSFFAQKGLSQTQDMFFSLRAHGVKSSSLQGKSTQDPIGCPMIL